MVGRGIDRRMSSERRISNLPAAPSPLVGRTELLGVLEAGLRADGVGRRWVLTGPDGIGKSAVAAACVGRRAADFDVAWWVRAGDPLVLAEDMRVLADRLGITWLGSRVADQMRRELALWLQSNERWLLVFDDVVDPGALRDYLPSSERGIVLATAPAWPAPDRGADEDPALGFEALAVPPLSTTDGAALVLAAGSKGRGRRARRGTTDEERAAAERIALITRGTPLALRLAAHAGPLEAVPQALVDCLALIYEEGANVTEAEDAPEAIEIALEVAARHAESVGVAAVEATLCLFALMGGVAVPAEMAAAVEQLVGKVRARKALRVALRAGRSEERRVGKECR